MDATQNRRVLLFGMGLILIITLLLLSQISYSWNGWAPEYCRSTNCYCEPFHEGAFVLQPLTAYSNLGFLITGLVILGIERNPKKIAAGMPRAYQNLLGILCILAGIFSFFSHASLTRVGEWVDLMGVYLLMGFFLFYNLRRFGHLSDRYFSIFYLLALILLGVQMAFAPQWQIISIAVLVIGVSLLEIGSQLVQKDHANRKFLYLAVIILGIGFIFWQWGGGRSDCFLIEGLPAHVFWHLCAAASTLILFFYYRGLQKINSNPQHSPKLA